MKVGVIGLGAMGAHMALNFHYAGFLHMVWNRTRAKAESMAEKTKVRIADTPQQLAAECDLIVICVPRDADVLEAVRTIATTIRPDTVVADTSTVSAETARQAAAILKEKRAHFLDCPVSGGVEGAQKGTLAIMAGGEEKILERVKPALSSIASNIAYIGPTGSGQACKAVNQIMAAGINQAVTEALAFGEAMGLDMNKVVDIVATGAAGNWFLDHRGRSMLAGKFTPGFKIGLHHKDLMICKSMLENVAATSLPMLATTLDDYQHLMDEGHAEEDISALFRLKRERVKGKKMS
jgi:3-hydroxyisobutyrate dehydrogenase